MKDTLQPFSSQGGSTGGSILVCVAIVTEFCPRSADLARMNTSNEGRQAFLVPREFCFPSDLPHDGSFQPHRT